MNQATRENVCAPVVQEESFRTLNRSVVDGERDCIALAQWHDFNAALHAGALLRENELATREISPRLGEQNRDLKRKR